MAYRQDKNLDALKNISEQDLKMLSKIEDNYEFYQHLRMYYFDAEQQELQEKVAKLEDEIQVDMIVPTLEEQEELKE